MVRIGNVVALAVTAAVVIGLAAPSETLRANDQVASVATPSYKVADPAMVTHRLTALTRQNLRCLALNIYWEARSEPITGQIAVAAVTLNRVEHSRFPESICDVVYQGGEARLHRCQFSWWCDGKRDEPQEADAWRRAVTLARLTAAGVIDDPTDGALWYHADYVEPDWAAEKYRITQIGRHIFYTLPHLRNVELTELADAQ